LFKNNPSATPVGLKTKQTLPALSNHLKVYRLIALPAAQKTHKRGLSKIPTFKSNTIVTL